MKLPRSLPGMIVLFAVLGLIDLSLTWYLLRFSSGHFYESNPVARWWLVRWGWAGLAGFKIATVLVVLASVSLIARSRPRRAMQVLTFACAATVLVVGYSCILLRSDPARRGILKAEREIVADADYLDTRLGQLQAYYRLRRQLAEDTVAGRYTLEEAVARLTASPWLRDPLWQARLRLFYPGRSPREGVAASFRDYVAALQNANRVAATAREGVGYAQAMPIAYQGSARENATQE